MIDADQAYLETMVREAMLEADKAAERGEVPVGCVITRQGRIIARAGNSPIGDCDPSAHAEIRALRRAGQALKNYRLIDCDLFVTLEPCVMCAGAMIHARLRRVVFGAADPMTGAAGSVFDVLGSQQHNHRVMVTRGVLADQCSEQLSGFFKGRRRFSKGVE